MPSALLMSQVSLSFSLQVMKAVADQYRLPAPQNCPPALHSLMLQCWQADRGDRPGFDSLLSSLDRLIRHPASLKAEPTRWDGSFWQTLVQNISEAVGDEQSAVFVQAPSFLTFPPFYRSCSQPLLSPTPTDLSSVTTVTDWLKALRMERYQDEFDRAHLDTLDRVSRLNMEWVYMVTEEEKSFEIDFLPFRWILSFDFFKL